MALRSTRRAKKADTAPPGPDGCAHLTAAGAAAEPAPLTPDCQGCAELGEQNWAHLRMCLTCGRVGCCDSSPRQHATAHFHQTGHPVMRSIEPGERWRWCYVHQELMP